MFEDYKKQQEELNNREKVAQKEYEVTKVYLSDYNKDLEILEAKFNSDKEALKLKHNYHSKKELYDKAYQQLRDVQSAKKDAKILFVLDAIYCLLSHPFYKNSEHRVWNFLWNEWEIRHEDYYYSFQAMYELIKRDGLDEVVVYAPSEYNTRDEYEVHDTKYFRGDTDECKVVFPKRVIDCLDEFVSSVEAQLEATESEMRKNEEVKRQNRLKMYEQLKAEFGS